MLASFLNPPVLGHTHTAPLSRTASSPAHSFYTDIYSALLLPLLRAQRQKNNFLLASLHLLYKTEKWNNATSPLWTGWQTNTLLLFARHGIPETRISDYAHSSLDMKWRNSRLLWACNHAGFGYVQLQENCWPGLRILLSGINNLRSERVWNLGGRLTHIPGRGSGGSQEAAQQQDTLYEWVLTWDWPVLADAPLYCCMEVGTLRIRRQRWWFPFSKRGSNLPKKYKRRNDRTNQLI